MIKMKDLLALKIITKINHINISNTKYVEQVTINQKIIK